MREVGYYLLYESNRYGLFSLSGFPWYYLNAIGFLSLNPIALLYLFSRRLRLL